MFLKHNLLIFYNWSAAEEIARKTRLKDKSNNFLWEINLDKLMLTRSAKVGEAYKEFKTKNEEATRKF